MNWRSDKMGYFYERPPMVQAIEFKADKSGFREVRHFFEFENKPRVIHDVFDRHRLEFEHGGKTFEAFEGDYIVRTSDGEYTVMAWRDFRQKYMVIPEGDPD